MTLQTNDAKNCQSALPLQTSAGLANTGIEAGVLSAMRADNSLSFVIHTELRLLIND
jgi:hypothetical protein